MGVISDVFQAFHAEHSGSPPGPGDNYWYHHVDMATAAGVNVSAETAMCIDAVYACVSIIARTLGTLPLILYERKSADDKSRAFGHPLYHLLHDRPNERHTKAEFWQMQGAHLALRGNAYSEIVPGRQGFAQALLPLHPDNVKVEVLRSGAMRYKVRDPLQPGAPERILLRDEVMHLMILSANGYVGRSPLQYHRETFGRAIASADYANRFFQNDATPRGVLEMPGEISEEAGKRLRDSWQANQTAANRHKTALLEAGVTYKDIGMTNTDAQFLELRKLDVNTIARIFLIPPAMIGDLERATFKNIEEQGINFVKHTMAPWFVTIEQAISRDLILRPERFFAEFLVEGLMRGDTKSRYMAYASAINAGWMTRNEARARENLNPLDGLDEPLRPLNMGTPGTLGPLDNRDERARAIPARVHAIVEQAAGRIARREAKALAKIAERSANDPEAWPGAVAEFFDGHAAHIAQALQIALPVAQADCEAAQTLVAEQGAAVLEGWEAGRTRTLTALALEMARNDSDPQFLITDGDDHHEDDDVDAA